MAIKKTYLILCLLLAGLLSLQFQCNKRLDCAENSYSFAMGVKAYPDKDSLRIGDTLWLEINEPTTLRDELSGRVINYGGASNLSTTIGIAELISVNNVDTKGNTFFRFLPRIGRETIRPDTNSVREYQFNEANGYYQFKIGIIPKREGVYKLFLGSASNVYRINDNCTKASFAVNFEQTNQHLYYNEIVLPRVTLPAGGGVYLFKVK